MIGRRGKIELVLLSIKLLYFRVYYLERSLNICQLTCGWELDSCNIDRLWSVFRIVQMWVPGTCSPYWRNMLNTKKKGLHFKSRPVAMTQKTFWDLLHLSYLRFFIFFHMVDIRTKQGHKDMSQGPQINRFLVSLAILHHFPHIVHIFLTIEKLGICVSNN